MVIELAMAGMLQCSLVDQRFKNKDILCFYQCQDSSREFASTLKNYRCPKRLYADRAALLFKDRDFKKNKWTEKDIQLYLKD
tara:strand:+ start:6289 stop:6534 length:246 start_codon:yes stop_codon:yes gene_type:complete